MCIDSAAEALCEMDYEKEGNALLVKSYDY